MATYTKEPSMKQLMERLERLGEAMLSWADSALTQSGTELDFISGRAQGSAGSRTDREEGASQVA